MVNWMRYTSGTNQLISAFNFLSQGNHPTLEKYQNRGGPQQERRAASPPPAKNAFRTAQEPAYLLFASRLLSLTDLVAQSTR